MKGIFSALALSLCLFTVAEAQIVLTGTVVSGGQGVVGADLDLNSSTGVSYSLSGDLTGVGGSFSMTVLQGPTDPTYTPGAYVLEVNPPPGFLGNEFNVNLTVGAGGGTQSLGNFTVSSGWVIQGQVVDEFGVGIPGMNLDINPDSGGDPLPLLTGDITDANGVFMATMQPLSNLEYRISLSPPTTPGPLPTTCGGFSPNPNCAAGVLPIRYPLMAIFGPQDLGVIQASPAVCLSARLVDINGTPIVGIDTQVTNALTDLNVPLDKDDSDCLGNVKVLVPRGTIDLLFRDPVPEDPPFNIDYAPVFFEGMEVLTDTDLGDVTMLLGRNVSGNVTLNGSALAGAEVEFLDAITGNVTPQSNDVTGAGGAFTYWVGDGNYEIEVDAPPAMVATVVPTRVAFTVSAGSTNVGTINLLSGFQVTGHCVDDTPITPLDVPFVDVEFQLSANGTRIEALKENANATGNFAATLVPNTYDVLLFPPVGSGRAPAVVPSVNLTASAAPLGDIVLGPGVAITGTVTSGIAPVTGATVEIVGGLHKEAVSELDGTIGFQLAAGVYDIVVTPPVGSLDPVLTILSVDLSADTVLALDLQSAPDPVSGLVCVGGEDNATLSWSYGPVVPETVEIRRDGVLVTTLPATMTSYLDTPLAIGNYTWDVTAVRAAQSATAASCTELVGNLPFIRGDVNLSGSINLSDAISGLAHLFQGAPAGCRKAIDFNDNGSLNIADIIGLLSYLFSGGAAPGAPFPACGQDPTPDTLDCLMSNCP